MRKKEHIKIVTFAAFCMHLRWGNPILGREKNTENAFKSLDVSNLDNIVTIDKIFKKYNLKAVVPG